MYNIYVNFAKVWLKYFFLAKNGRFEKKEFRSTPIYIYVYIMRLDQQKCINMFFLTL